MRTFTLQSALTAFACLAMAGCQSADTNPASISRNNGKSPQVLSDICVNAFAGITNCSIGNASISHNQAAGTVTVTGIGGSGQDGVSSSFASAASWEQQGDANLTGSRQITYSAKSEGNAVSTITRSSASSGTITMTPTFTSAPGEFRYTAEFYNGDNLVASRPGMTPSSTFKQIPTGPGCWVWVRFSSNPCKWELRWKAPCPIQVFELNDQARISATRVVFTEEVNGGNYPYRDFQAIDVQGTMESYLIGSETTTLVE